ncbi:MAG: glycoside hydrolase family 28 protein [Prevotella sp.]|nr:glycoside hydrolase family 28 protein [Prevotella sp.]
MRKLFLFISLCVAITMQAQENKYAKYFKNLPFKMEVFGAPVIPNNTVNLKDFGAVGDGRTLCTDAFHKAMQALSKKGGGRLVVPEGVWLTGPLDLVSNLDLHLKSGAIILFSDDETLYPVIKTYYEGWEAYRTHSPIYGKNLVNVSITGHGVIDGNGQYWRPLKKEKVTEAQWKKFTAKGGVIKDNRLWYPSESYAYGEQHAREITSKANPTQEELSKIRRFVRPVMISLVGCKNVLLKGVIFQNSGAWNIHPLMCENVIIEDVLAKNPSYAQNGDALDLESCKNALIINSKFDAGDDGICIKSGKDEEGRKRARPCENVIVDGCTVFAGHGGFVVGSEMSGGVKNILVKNCQFMGTDVGLRFKSRRGRGGVVENIFIRDIAMTNILSDAIIFNLYYGGKSVIEVLESGEKVNNIESKPVDETTPCFRKIDIQNITCQGAGRAMMFNGLPEMPIDGISLKNVTIYADSEAEFYNCKNIKKENVNVILKK